MTVDVTKDQVRVLAEMQGLQIPEEDLPEIVNRMSLWLSSFEQLERELGPKLNDVDPIPPVFPREDM